MADSALVFWPLAILLVLTALIVITHRNPVRSALFLIGHMLLVALVFLTRRAQFLAAVQVVVYAGAIMVLFLFTIMLLNLGVSRNDPKWRGAGFLGAVGVVLAMALGMVGGAVWRSKIAAPAPGENLRLGGTAQSVGYALFDPELPWMFAFELTSIVLLAALVGAVVLAKRRL